MSNQHTVDSVVPERVPCVYRKRASRARRGSPHSTTRVRPALATRRQTTRREARGRVTSASARRGRGSRNARKAEERRCALSRSNARDGAWCCVCPSPPGPTARPPRLGRSRERARETLDRRHGAVVWRSSCAAAHSAPSHAGRRACRGRPSRCFLGRVVCWLLRDPGCARARSGALGAALDDSSPLRRASDPFIAFVRVPRRRRLRKSVRLTSARARLRTPRRPR